MSIKRQVNCDIAGCKQEIIELALGDGWPGWGHLQGRQGPNGEAKFILCPEHLNAVFAYIGELEIK